MEDGVCKFYIHCFAAHCSPCSGIPPPDPARSGTPQCVLSVVCRRTVDSLCNLDVEMTHGAREAPTILAVRAQDLGPYPAPSLHSSTILSSVDGGHSRGGTAGGGSAPADPAAQEELFVDNFGTSAVWRTLGGQVSHTSFRSAVLGPGAHGLAGNNGHGAIAQVVRCRFAALLEGWSSMGDREQEGPERQHQQQEQHQEQQENGQQARQQRRRSRDRRGPWSVCILRAPDLVTVHFPNGDSYDVTLPCEARLLQPVREGLLVQRFSGDADDADDYDGGGEATPSLEGKESRPATSGFMDVSAFGHHAQAGSGQDEQDVLSEDELSDAVPSLFTLRHPLDELRPVALLPPSTAGTRSITWPTEDQQRLVCDASERVVFAGGGGGEGTGPDTSLLVTYNTRHRRHSLWLMLPVQDPVPEPEPELRLPQRVREPMGPPPAPTAVDESFLGPLVHQTPQRDNSRRVSTPGLSSPPVADASSLSSTLLGVSALDSSSSIAGLSMLDGVLRRDRLSIGGSIGRGRMSGGAGRRASSGSNTSWVGPGSTRNEALASALGLGQSGLGVSSSVLALGPAGQHGGGGAGGGGGGGARRSLTESFLPPRAGGSIVGAVAGAGAMALEDVSLMHDLHEEEDGGEEEDEEEEQEGTQPIRPHLGLSLLWRESQDSPSPASHVFCAAATGTLSGNDSAADVAASATAATVDYADISLDRKFILCIVHGEAGSLRALSISVAGAASRGDSQGDETGGFEGGVTAAEGFTTPCRAAVGLCATAGAEGEDTPGGTIASDILLLTRERRLVLQRGESDVTEVAVPTNILSSLAMEERDEGDEPDALSEAVGSCFTLATRAGARRRLRLSLDSSSPLVAACLSAWDCLLTPALATSLRADVVCVAQCLATSVDRGDGVNTDTIDSNSRVTAVRSSVDGNGGMGASTVGGDVDWAALVSVMRELVLGGRETASAAANVPAAQRGSNEARKGGQTNWRGAGSGDDGGHGSAWAALLSSPFHDQYARDSVMMLSGLRTSGREQGSDSQHISTASMGPPPPHPLHPPLQTRRSAFCTEAGTVLDALHLVLEDLKTSRLTVSLVPRLASLLLSLARVCGQGGQGMRDFADHYWRDAAGCGNGRGEAASMICSGDSATAAAADTAERRGGSLPSRPTRFHKVRQDARCDYCCAERRNSCTQCCARTGFPWG